ncbi:Mor transcription activator family protein [Rhodanobacter lindaniclasticus]
MNKPQQTRSSLLNDVEMHAAAILVGRGIPEVDAKHAATEVADFLAGHWGGSVITIPKDIRWRTGQRDREMLGKFTGSNYRELAVEYGMTERGIRKALERALINARRGR